MPETTHNAKDILVEALATIKATFWVQGEEFSIAAGTVLSWNQDKRDYDYDFTSWDQIEKAFVIDADKAPGHCGQQINPKTRKLKVTGVCSIGAIALANVTLYDEPLSAWHAIAERDIETWKAAAAVAMAIQESDPNWCSGELPGNCIASWNDAEDRTREQVIDSFERALQNPLLDSPAPVEILRQLDWGPTSLRLWFADEEAAQAFLAGDSKLRQHLRVVWGSETEFIVQPIDHEGLVPA